MNGYNYSWGGLSVAAVLAVCVFALSALALSRTAEMSRDQRCLWHLRKIGRSCQSFTEDHDGRLLRSMQGGIRLFQHGLYEKGYLNIREAMDCPAEGVRYGVRRWGMSKYETSFEEEAFGQKRRATYFEIGKIPQPSDFMLIGDSLRDGEDRRGSEFFTFDEGTGSLHLRHSGAAHLLFADGSVRAADRRSIREAWQSEPPVSDALYVINEEYEIEKLYPED